MANRIDTRRRPENNWRLWPYMARRCCRPQNRVARWPSKTCGNPLAGSAPAAGPIQAFNRR
eukprot:8385902-Lingulodinium_polyedra.AAC.1